jgi:hypothetical protein
VIKCPILLHCSSSFWPLKQRPKRHRLTPTSIKKIDRVSAGFDRVARVARVSGQPGFTGLTLERVFASTRTGSRPGSAGSRVDLPGRPGFTGPTLERVFASTRTGPRPGSARRAGPGFKTLSMSLELASKSNVFILTMQKSMKRPYYPYIQGKVLL